MSIHHADHPLIRHKLGLMRVKDITTKDFRDLASEVASLLTYEATKDLITQKKGWAGDVEVDEIRGKKITIVPILRAGLGMMNGVLDMIPSAKVSVAPAKWKNALPLFLIPCWPPAAPCWPLLIP